MSCFIDKLIWRYEKLTFRLCESARWRCSISDHALSRIPDVSYRQRGLWFKKKKSDQPINWEKPWLTPPHPTFYWSVNGSSSFFTIQQVAPQAAKTMSPPFARMGGFGGGSSTSFDQMPTGASPTTTSGANYPAHNVRASLNNNGYGRLCA